LAIESSLFEMVHRCLDEVGPNAEVEGTTALKNLCVAVEYYVPKLLREIHQKWRREGLDGVLPCLARSPGKLEFELFAVAILMSDQTYTPLHVRLKLTPDFAGIEWLECRIGCEGPDGMERQSEASVSKMIYELAHTGRCDRLRWAYEVGIGTRGRGRAW
jgi:hypothetical protein